MRNMRLAELIFNTPLLISEQKLNSILHAVGPRFNLDVSGISPEMAVKSDEERRRCGYRVDDGVGIIGIYGPLMHRRLAADYPSGGPTTYGEIRTALQSALSDDGVQSIMLDIDSPGGMVSGVFDLAESIRQAHAIKPVTAFVNESAFSAGYLLASAAGRIILPRTGSVGSVGVVYTHVDFSRAEDQAGVTVTHVYAGRRKIDATPHAPLTSDALSAIQSEVADLYDLFVKSVAGYRNIDESVVRGTEAATYLGHLALDAGLADEITNHAQAFLYSKSTGSSRKGITSMKKEKRTMNMEQLKTDYPELYQAVKAEGTADLAAAVSAARHEGAEAERARIRGIQEAAAATPGHAELIASLMFDGTSTAGDAALAILKAENEARTAALASITGQANAPAPASAPDTAGEPAADAPIEEQARAAWDKDKALQGEFKSFDAYLAWKKADASGLARVYKTTRMAP